MSKLTDEEIRQLYLQSTSPTDAARLIEAEARKRMKEECARVITILGSRGDELNPLAKLAAKTILAMP